MIDKMPDNYSLIGWIATLFPAARSFIADAIRAIAVVLADSSARSMGLALARPARSNKSLPGADRHWRAVLPVDSSNPTTRRWWRKASRDAWSMAGLDWITLPALTRENLVRTASQVRQPIWRSVARWRAYLPFIPELADICLESCTQRLRLSRAASSRPRQRVGNHASANG
jgi:hypothetical protein